ncbi:MAG: hypothetical protein E7Z72_00660 [Methanocorpusculum parvum]|nr:hypothetical protein [Methanocorpusculum parvum]
MTINTGFFSNGKYYTQNDFAPFIADAVSTGVVHGVDDSLAVTAYNPASMAVNVGLGRAYIDGYFISVTGEKAILTINPSGSAPRIDRVVLQLSRAAAQKITLYVKQGVEAASPVPPALQRDTDITEISLAQVNVGAGVIAINAQDIIDERYNADACGRAHPGSSPSTIYATCTTARATAAKTTTLPDFALITGALAVLRFPNGNSAPSPTLNISGTGARPITARGEPLPSWAIRKEGVYAFSYNGTSWEFVGSLTENNPNMTVYGFIVDETNSDPSACITYTGASAGFSAADAQAVFKQKVKHCVVKGAKRQFYVNEADWSKKTDGSASGVANGTSLSGNFMLEYPSFWWRVTPLGTDIHHVEFTWDDPGSNTDWIPCHLYDGRIAEYIYVGAFKGYNDNGKLRSIYSTSLKPTVSLTNEAFRNLAQATGSAEGLSGKDNTYTISQPLPYIMRTLLKYWAYKTLDLQTNVARGICNGTWDDGGREICVGISLTGGNTQGIPGTTGTRAAEKSAVVNGEIDPYGGYWEFMIDFAYRFREMAFAIDGADHLNITTLTTANWDTTIPTVWRKVFGVGTGAGYIRRMLWDKFFPFVSLDVAGGSATTHWSDYTYRNTADTETSKTPRCCLAGADWDYGSYAGPACLHLNFAVGSSDSSIGARLQCHSLT